jgi:hypothetical protein
MKWRKGAVKSDVEFFLISMISGAGSAKNILDHSHV